MTQDETAVFSTTSLLQNLTYPLLIAAMSAMIFLAILTAIQIATPTTSWVPLVALCFLAALAGVYSTNWLNQFEQLAVSRVYYRIAELAFLFVIVRLFTWIAAGNGWPSLDVFRFYLRAPIAFFTDAYFLISFVFVAAAWQRGVAFSGLFSELALSRAEITFFTQRGRQSADAPIHPVRTKLVASFFSQWIGGGVVLLIGVALSTFQLGEVTRSLNLLEVTRQSVRPSLVLGLLAYFLIGFWLLSQARLLALNGRWLIEGVTPSDEIPRNWARQSWRILFIFGLIAAFVPIGSTVPAARVLSFLLAGIVYIVNFLFFLFSFLFVGLLGFLFGGEQQTGTEAQTPPPPPSFEELLPPPAASSPNEMLIILVTSLIWSLIIVGGVGAALYVLRDRGTWVNGRFFHKLWHTFKKWLAELWLGVEGQLALVQEALQARRAEAEDEPSAPVKPPWRFVRLNGLTPREQIRYFYLSTVKRAGQKGVMRDESNTPLEYVEQLKREWPDAEAELETLTDAFLRARYSPQPVEKETVSPIKQQWQRVKRNLRRRRRGEA